ncbi:hypothetical protein [Saccharopolyspora tripterygii]
MLAIVLAVLSGVCLVAGWSLEAIVLVYAALGLSALGLLLVLSATLRGRRSATANSPETGESSDTANSPDAEESSTAGEVLDDAADDAAEPASASELTREVFVERTSGDRLDSDATVHVLQRRKRFHTEDCRLVRDKQAQELTLVEAREENFTPCSVCIEVGAAALLSEQR